MSGQGGSKQTQRLRVRGQVQGVGFRPTVWRLAVKAGLLGEVLNDAEGVLIRLACDAAVAREFAADLRRAAPPLSRIDAIEITGETGQGAWHDFSITASRGGEARTGITPDAATCPDCLADILDPASRRHGYAFTNCTNCGPRLSIIRAIPYDRAKTAMADFTMCPDCQAEYDDPADRRFHAQPNACPACGPKLWVEDADGGRRDDTPIDHAAALLRAGKILAIKGLGGFQLACDARNPAAVDTLRARKRRPAKPFALMALDVEQVTRFARLSKPAQKALSSPVAPIVLAPTRPDGANLAPGIAPGQNRLGFMLPNTPLHHLLLRAFDGPLVMTSGNLSGEPQVIDNAEARSRLAPFSDYWLMHDRGVVNRLDDSVVQPVGSGLQILRRARGHAPAPLDLHPGFTPAAPLLAMGGDLKNTFCLLKDGQAVTSQHMGDMENPRTHRDLRANLALYQGIFDMTPAAIAVDAHPGYFSTRMGQEIAARQGIDTHPVQHHHAHVASVLAEQGHGPDAPPVLGVVLDGLGFGADGTLWGGEFLLADFLHFQQLAHFDPVALPGGDMAGRQPWRNTLAHLLRALGPGALGVIRSRWGALPLLDDLGAKPCDMIARMIDSGLNAPQSSSAGRLFDAVAGALGLCFDGISFEGQAAMQLQALAEHAPADAGAYPVEPGPRIEWAGLWQGILADLAAQTPKPTIAARFHNSLIAATVETARQLCRDHDLHTVVLGGGVFQNALLLSGVRHGLENQGLSVLTPVQYPANDGGLSLGQACIAAARLLAGKTTSQG